MSVFLWTMVFASSTIPVGKSYDGERVSFQIVREKVADLERSLAGLNGAGVACIGNGTLIPETVLRRMSDMSDLLAKGYLLLATNTPGYGAFVYAQRALELDPGIEVTPAIQVKKANERAIIAGEDSLADYRYVADIKIHLSDAQQKSACILLEFARQRREESLRHFDTDMMGRMEDVYSGVLEGYLPDPVITAPKHG